MSIRQVRLSPYKTAFFLCAGAEKGFRPGGTGGNGFVRGSEVTVELGVYRHADAAQSGHDEDPAEPEAEVREVYARLGRTSGAAEVGDPGEAEERGEC